MRAICAAAPERMRELMHWGMRFDLGEHPAARSDSRVPPVDLGREGGHSHARILHSDGDATGRELSRAAW